MHRLHIIFGAIGFLLGLFRWWASVIWLVFPMSGILILHNLVTIDEINMMYENIVRELGKSYIWHHYISMTMGVLLNAGGIFINFLKPRNIILQ